MWVIAAFYLSVGANVGMIYLDDGASVLGAWNVLNGLIPYRDFLIIGGPGHFYILAFLFKVSGPLLIVERLYNSFVLAGIVATVYRLSLSFVPKVWACMASFLALVVLGSYPHYSGGQPLSVLLAIVSMDIFVRSSKNEKGDPALVWCGVLSALSCVVRQDVGASVVAAQIIGIALLRRRDVSVYLAGLCGVLAVAGGVLMIFVPAERLFYAYWEYPARVYSQYATRKFPLDEGTISDRIMVVLPFVVYPAALVYWFRHRRKKELIILLVVILWGVFSLNQARLRPDAWHFLSTWAPCIVLAGLLSERLWNSTRSSLLRVALGAVFLSVTIVPVVLKAAITVEPGLVPSALERAKGIRYIETSYGSQEHAGEFMNYERAVRYLQEHTAPGEKVFVGSSRHDRVCSADPLFYFLADRPSAIYDPEMHRGYFNTVDAQEKAIAEIKANRVRYVVLRELLDAQCVECNASVNRIGDSPLDAYIRSHYRPVESFGTDHILEIA